MKDLVRKTTFWVVKNSAKNGSRASVFVNRQKIRELAEKLAGTNLKIPPWPAAMHLKTKNEKTMVDYLIVLDALNFCFWSEGRKKWHILYKGKKYDGYFALSLALKEFFGNFPDRVGFRYFSRISFPEFLKILQGGKNLLLKKKRWEILRRVSKAILKKYGGDSLKFVASAGGKVDAFVWKIFRELPSFNDCVLYRGKKIYILKRAQILAVDIWGALKGRGIGKFRNLGRITAFSDYKVPQILEYYGILEYSPQLTEKIKSKIIIPAGSAEETEIRSATIWAAEYLRRELAKLGKKLRPFEIDWILWNKSQKQKMKMPYHRTKTIFY